MENSQICMEECLYEVATSKNNEFTQLRIGMTQTLLSPGFIWLCEGRQLI